MGYFVFCRVYCYQMNFRTRAIKSLSCIVLYAMWACVFLSLCLCLFEGETATTKFNSRHDVYFPARLWTWLQLRQQSQQTSSQWSERHPEHNLRLVRLACVLQDSFLKSLWNFLLDNSLSLSQTHSNNLLSQLPASDQCSLDGLSLAGENAPQ